MPEPDWEFHCAEFADAAAGLGLAEQLGGWPRNWREAVALYRRFGVRTMGDLLSLFQKEIAPLRAMRGDVVMIDNAFGVCRGDWAQFMDRMQPMRRATRAWSAKARIYLGDQRPAGSEGMNGDPPLGS